MSDVAGIDRRLCGWRVRSAIPLPELPGWLEDGHPVDIDIRLGSVPPQIEDPIHRGPVLQIGRDRSCRFALPAVGSFLLRGGREIIVEPREGVANSELGLFLLGSLFGLLCHQRGLLPLHASCVLIGGAAIAFAGASGAGKSTLAARFAARGHPIIADDVLPIDPAGSDGPVAHPAIPRLRLWRDALEAMGRSPVGLPPIRKAIEKYEISTGTVLPTAPVPLTAIFYLETVGTSQLAANIPLSGIDAVLQLRSMVYRGLMADRMGLSARVAAAAMQTATGLQLQIRLRRLPGLSRLDATMNEIEAVVAGLR